MELQLRPYSVHPREYSGGLDSPVTASRTRHVDGCLLQAAFLGTVVRFRQSRSSLLRQKSTRAT